MTPTRRDLIALGAGLAGGAALTRYAGLEGSRSAGGGGAGGSARTGREEYVWLSAHRTLPLFVANDHPALEVAGRELGVRVTIAGPDTVDIPGLVAAVEQTAVRLSLMTRMLTACEPASTMRSTSCMRTCTDDSVDDTASASASSAPSFLAFATMSDGSERRSSFIMPPCRPAPSCRRR